MSREPSATEFHQVARLPAGGDNVAIATRRLEAGTTLSYNGTEFTLSHTILEGHRFALWGIEVGEELFSWDLPFGKAVRRIEPGSYACNAKILETLRGRRIDFELPPEPNFRDSELEPYELDFDGFEPGRQVPGSPSPATFEGYPRGSGRGVGTRNYILVLGVNSQAGSYAKKLEDSLSELAREYPNVSGVAAVSHTEGGEGRRPNNLELLLRTLAGFVVHPNVGAALIVDEASGAVTGEMLRRYMVENGYPLSDLPHHFLTLERSFSGDLETGEGVVRGWMQEVDGAARTEQPLSELKVALQCGGSDAFSGVSANPLVGWVAKEVIRNGGSANLAETDELIGAEHYVLQNVRDLATARRFLGTVERFKERVSWHGQTAEGNPSGGNNYRGLYNIAIKSLGAAMKRDPEVRLDHVIEYGERMTGPGYYFMDSPGNDLESIAGQVASGANMIFFTTGNGSITNFPFVPTLKFVTTTGRYELLSEDMDVNAGEYLDGTPMAELGREVFEKTLAVAAGARTVGERAGHSQVSIWRDWKQTGEVARPARVHETPEPAGRPLRVRGSAESGDVASGPAGGEEPAFEALRLEGGGYAADQVALIMPTSLCSGQISLMISQKLNERMDEGLGREKVSRFVALPHTEGCGVSSGPAESIYARTVVGYLSHPSVRTCLLLEHGCEKTHNDYFRNQLLQRGLDPDRFGWASVQLDGGIERVVERTADWFATTLDELPELERKQAGFGALRLGLHAVEAPSAESAVALAGLTRAVVGAGGTVVIPEHSALLRSEPYLEQVLEVPLSHPATPTLSYGGAPAEAGGAGLHIMESPTDNWVEAATGLAATGVELMLAHVGQRPLQSHRMVPLIQVSEISDRPEDLDALLSGEARERSDAVLELVAEVASRRYTPKLHLQGNVGFQFTRGLLGVSM